MHLWEKDGKTKRYEIAIGINEHAHRPYIHTYRHTCEVWWGENESQKYMHMHMHMLDNIIKWEKNRLTRLISDESKIQPGKCLTRKFAFEHT